MGALESAARAGDGAAQEKLKRIGGISAADENRFLTEQATGLAQAGILDAEQLDKFMDGNVAAKRAILSQASAAMLMQQEQQALQAELQLREQFFRQQREIDTEYDLKALEQEWPLRRQQMIEAEQIQSEASRQRSADNARIQTDESIRGAKARIQMERQEERRQRAQQQRVISNFADFLGATDEEREMAAELPPEEALEFLEQQQAARQMAPMTLDTRFQQATLPNGEVVTVDMMTGKVVSSSALANAPREDPVAKYLTPDPASQSKGFRWPWQKAPQAQQAPAPAPAPVQPQSTKDLLGIGR